MFRYYLRRIGVIQNYMFGCDYALSDSVNVTYQISGKGVVKYP